MDNGDTQFMVTRKIRFYPNKEQKVLFKKCFDTHRYFYNKTIAFLKKEKVSLNLCALRNKIMKTDAELNLSEKWQSEIPFDTRQLAIKEAIGSYKSSLALLKNKQITHFNHKFKHKKDTIQIFHVDKSAYKNNKIFVRRLGKEKSNIRLRKKYKKLLKNFLPNGIEHDFIIQKTNTNKYYLIVSKKVKPEILPKKQNQIALDPGIRTFQTGYSPGGLILECGKKELDKIRKLHEQIDNLKSLRTKGIQRLRRIFEKCTNIVNNLHRQVVSFLTKNFNEIYYPSFNTKNMLKRNHRKISPKTAREMQVFSFYRFKQLLQCVAKRRNTNVILVDEKYTTKTCGNCGIMNMIGSNKIYNCTTCHVKLSRDINAARNIFMKNVVLNQ